MKRNILVTKRLEMNFVRNISWIRDVLGCGSRSIHCGRTLALKQIHEEHEGKTLKIWASYYESARKPYMFEHAANQTQACPLCRTNLDLKHTDVLILSQFVRTDGCMMPRRVTKLCKKQQKRVTYLVAMAQKAGLMTNLTPPNSKCDPSKRREHKQFNTYFDESTIKC